MCELYSILFRKLAVAVCVCKCVCMCKRCEVWDTCAVAPADFTSGVKLKGRGLGKERRSLIRYMQI